MVVPANENLEVGLYGSHFERTVHKINKCKAAASRQDLTYTFSLNHEKLMFMISF